MSPVFDWVWDPAGLWNPALLWGPPPPDIDLPTTAAAWPSTHAATAAPRRLMLVANPNRKEVAFDA